MRILENLDEIRIFLEIVNSQNGLRDMKPAVNDNIRSESFERTLLPKYVLSRFFNSAFLLQFSSAF